MKAHVTTAGDDAAADVCNDAAQHIGADMRLCLPENLLRRARRHERLKDPRDERRVLTRRKLSVGERAGTALAKLHVAARIEHAGPMVQVDIGRALLDGCAALDDDRAQPRFRKFECGEQPGRAHSHYHGATVAQMRVGCFALSQRLDSLRRARAIADADGRDEVHVVLVARIDRASQQVGLLHMQNLGKLDR